ncbi:MAG TPA: diguanylate cyclase [Thermoleophilaceae bacterium]|jgi:diguanylate cyclase (GGDEF)-like protein/PAS domain S-box-containing protein
MPNHDPPPAERAGQPRPRLLLALAVPGIAASLAAYALLWGQAYRGPTALVLLFVAAIVYATFRESELRMGSISICGNVIPFFAAVELAGPLIAGIALTVAHVVLDVRRRRSFCIVLSNVLSHLLVALAAAGALALLDDLLTTRSGEPLHLLVLIVAGFSADSVTYLMLVGLTWVETNQPSRDGILRPYLGVARIVALGMCMTAAVVWVHQEGGLAALAVALVALPVFYELVDRINRIENELRVERDRNARYLAVAGSMFLVLDRDGRITLINERGAELLGRPESELVGADWFALTAPADEVSARREDFVRRLARGDAPPGSESSLALGDGDERIVTWNTTVLRDDDGSASGMLVSSEDVTARRRAEERVAYLAYHDQLTGLGNRVAFEQRLERTLAGADAAGAAVALYFLDVDGFKAINDELGHAAGDGLLREIGTRLGEAVRGDDLVVRQGGDEFLLLSRMARDGLDTRLENLRARVEEVFERPFDIDGRALAISVSIGVAVYPDHAADGEALIRRADDEMYRAKRRSGRARIAHAPGA